MDLGDDDGLVLDSRPYRDRHLLLTVLTPGHGPVRGVLRGARGGKTPAAAAAQVLSLVRTGAFLSPRAELATFRRLDLVESSFPLARDLARFAAANVVAELLTTFCPPFEPAPKPFRLGRTALTGLLGGVDPDVVVAYAELWTLAFAGVLPPFDRCSACDRALEPPISIRTEDGLPVCRRCAPSEAWALTDADLAFLVRCRRLPLKEVDGPAPAAAAGWLDRAVRDAAERPLHALDFLRRHARSGR